MLSDYDTGTNYLTDTESATSVQAMRRASKNILYTVVGSRLYEEHSFDDSLKLWEKIMIGADAVVLLLLVLAEVGVVRSYLKKNEE